MLRWYDKVFIGFMVSCVLAMFPLAYWAIKTDRERVQWCHEQGYKAVSVGGRSASTLCVDSERRLIVPGGK